jgi:hypothetical protein
MKNISGYELSVIFQSDELNETEVNNLMEKVFDLFDISGVVSTKLVPIVEDET